MFSHRGIMRRALALCLCAVLLSAFAAYAEGDETTLTALPTPTPVPATLQTAAEEATEPPTQPPTAPPTDTPVPPSTDTPAPAAESTATPESAATPGPEDTATAAPEHTPTASSAASPTASPEASPSASPSASPTATATATPAPSGAPTCAIPGCEHVGINEKGDLIALCELGKWLLAQAEAETQPGGKDGLSLDALANKPIALELKNGVNTIYRSGTYAITGGGARAKLNVAKGRVVSLQLKNVTLATLNLLDSAVATLGFEEQNTIATIAAPKATLVIDGVGSLAGVTNLNCMLLTVMPSGSVHLPQDAESSNGLKEYVFYAKDAVNVKVDGEGYTFTTPNTNDNSACLWLPVLQGGASYRSSLAKHVLTVSSLPEEPDTKTEYSLSDSARFTPEAGKAYDIVEGDSPQSKTLTVDVTGVSISLDGIGDGSYQPSLDAREALTAFLSGQNVFASVTAASGKTLTLSGSGSLTVGTLHAPDLSAMGSLVIAAKDIVATPCGWRAVTASANLGTGVTAYFGGKKVALLYDTDDPLAGYAPLPVPKPGYRYEGKLKSKKLTIEAVASAPTTLTLSGGADVDLTDGNYRVISDANKTTSGSIVIAAGATVALELSDVQTSGSLIVGDGATVNLSLTGSSGFAPGTLQLGAGAKLSISGPGSLMLSGVSGSGKTTIGDSVNVSLLNGTALPGSKLKPTVISVTNQYTKPLRSTAVTLKLGKQKPFSVTTCDDGNVTLWRKAVVTGVDAVVLSDENTYATIVKAGAAAPDANPVVKSVTLSGNCNVTVTTDIAAATKGVMYVVTKNGADVTIPDTYWDKADIAYANSSGVCAIPALKNGEKLVLRAFASVKAAKLKADTADAFGFGEQISRETLNIGKQTKVYDGASFKLNTKLYPSGSTITYYKSGTKLSGAPKDVGKYVIRVKPPTSSTEYLSVACDVTLVIAHIDVAIYPLPGTKLKGEDDPKLDSPNYYTYDETVMLSGDTVTGDLGRVKGEAYGNYAYTTDFLVAKDYYYLYIPNESPCFFIDWGPHHYIPYDPFKKIDPVFDEIHLSNGKTVSVQITTTDLLKVDKTYFGEVVSDTEDGKARPFTPTLRLLGGQDSILLILTAEAELNKDGGYATDLDGNRVWRGRRLKLTNSTLNQLAVHNVDYIAFSLNGVSVTLSLDALRSGGAADKLIAEAGFKRLGSTYDVYLEPVQSQLALLPGEQSASESVKLQNPLMRVRVVMQRDSQEMDLTPALVGSASISFDASALLPQKTTEQRESAVTETVNGKPVAQIQAVTDAQQQQNDAIDVADGTAVGSYELLGVVERLLTKEVAMNGYGLYRFGDKAEALDSAAVVPYTASETRTAKFEALMRTKPYLTASFEANGLYGLSSWIN